MSCSPQGLDDGNDARLKLGDRVQMMIARKYRPKLTKVDDKENENKQKGDPDFTHCLFGIFVMLEKLKY